MTRWLTRCGVLLAAGLALASCGGSSGNSSSKPLQTLPKKTVSTTAVNFATTTTTAPAQTLTLTPNTGVAEGQTLQVSAKGFKPNTKGLLVLECADKGSSTGSGDCGLDHAQSANADASGNVTASVKVTKGPIGANKDMCTATQKCVVSVSEAAVNGASASTTIGFAG